MLEDALARNPAATELGPPLASIYARLGRREEGRAMLLRWRPGATQEALDNIALSYPYTYRWSVEGQGALDRLIDGMIVAALPLGTSIAEVAGGLSRGGVFARAHAARTLARFGAQAAEAVPALVEALDDGSPVVRAAVVGALAKIGPKAGAAIPALSNLDDPKLKPMADDAIQEIEGR